jgi:hypothetical protein
MQIRLVYFAWVRERHHDAPSRVAATIAEDV